MTAQTLRTVMCSAITERARALVRPAETYAPRFPDALVVQASNLATLTGWSAADIEQRMNATGQLKLTGK